MEPRKEPDAVKLEVIHLRRLQRNIVPIIDGHHIGLLHDHVLRFGEDLRPLHLVDFDRLGIKQTIKRRIRYEGKVEPSSSNVPRMEKGADNVGIAAGGRQGRHQRHGLSLILVDGLNQYRFA